MEMNHIAYNLPEIIIANDDDELNELIFEKLENFHCKISTVMYGRDLIAKLNSNINAILLLDYRLPDMTVREVIDKITNEKNIPFIIMTGFADIKTAIDLMKLGARDYLIKDSGFLELLPATIKKILDQLFTESKLVETENALQKSEEKYKILYENALIGMMSARMTDRKITDINELGCELLGYANKNLIIGQRVVTDMFIESINEPLIKELKQRNIITNREIQLRKYNSSVFWSELSAKLYSDENKIEIVFTDISKRKEIEAQIYSLTNYDQLTKLPNKVFFITHIQEEITRCVNRRKNNIFAVMCLGIDKFKHINSIYGHNIGNLLLQKIGAMLKKSLFRNDVACRFDGDKFMILFSDLSSRENVGNLVKKIHNVFSNPIEINNIKFMMSATAGMCTFPDDGENADILIKNSQSAMDMAKARGLNTHFFDAALNAEVINSFQIMKELKDAITNKEFIAYYQPKVTYNGEIVGMESLIRWQSPSRGLVPPYNFIPVAEKNGMIIEIGNLILQKSCIQNMNWIEKGYRPLKMAVNLSPFQFRQTNLVKDIEKILEFTKLPPQWLELEITESGIIENEKDSIAKINEMHELGISVSIDDFGTGYSSLSKLKDYPIDTLKIDKFFVDNIPYDKKSVTIATTIIDLAHNLGFKVVAEGVETKEQLDFLEDQKCDFYQGYYFSKPLPPDAFDNKLIVFPKINN
jgi:diguanylate cyclase (GGDEF)-like protein/PAS domain S-box-containing protein